MIPHGKGTHGVAPLGEQHGKFKASRVKPWIKKHFSNVAFSLRFCFKVNTMCFYADRLQFDDVLNFWYLSLSNLASEHTSFFNLC